MCYSCPLERIVAKCKNISFDFKSLAQSPSISPPPPSEANSCSPSFVCMVIQLRVIPNRLWSERCLVVVTVQCIALMSSPMDTNEIHSVENHNHQTSAEQPSKWLLANVQRPFGHQFTHFIPFAYSIHIYLLIENRNLYFDPLIFSLLAA